MDNEKEFNYLLNEIDNVTLIPKDELDNMNFYELCYYMQTLNVIDSIANNIEGGASVRRIVYSWWKPNMVIPSKEPLVSLGAEIVR